MRLRNILQDCGEIILEIVFLLIMTFSPWLVQLEMSSDVISKPEQIVWWVVTSHGKLPQAVALFIFWLLAIRKYNKDSVLNSTSIYHDYPLFFYRLAAFFGYKKCNLVGVPIYLQIQVVMCQLFESYPTLQDYQKEDAEVSSEPEKPNFGIHKINLLVADSYNIQKEQIPTECQSVYTIKITRTRKKGVRLYNPKFIEAVVSTIASFPDNCELHYFATTNPKTQEQITLQAFVKGGRGNIGKLIVYQQEATEPRNFIKKVTIIYK